MKVSVYCLVFNHEKYLRSALEGFICQQTNFEFEVFVHDDASADGSRKVIEEYAGRYPDVIKPIYQQENQYSKGVRIFSTFILPRITGDYVAVCEGDDYWTDSLKLQRQADFLDENPDYVACVHNTTMRDMCNGKKKEMYHHTQDDDLSFFDVVQGGSCSYHTSSLMYRVEYARNRPEFMNKSKWVGDYPLAIYLALSGKIRFLNYNMSLYRMGTEYSWTTRNKFDLHKQALSCQGIADMLVEVNRYTEYKYDDILRKRILKSQYTSLYLDEKYTELLREPYYRIFLEKPFTHRLKVYIKRYFNGLYHCYRKIFYGRKG